MRSAAYACGALALLFAEAQATAQTPPDCTSLKNPVFAGGSSAVKPLLKAIGTKLAMAATSSTTLIYQSSASCNGVTAFTDGMKLADAAVYWDATGTQQTCNVAMGGQTPDIGFSDVFPTTCTSNPLPAGVGEFRGPIQVMAFVTGAGSSETSISADAAYVAIGFHGAMNMVAPWADPNFFFFRPDTSGTKKMIATAIGLPVAKWNTAWDMTTTSMHLLKGSGDVLAAVTASTNANATLGILSGDWFDPYRQPNMGKQLKVLAFKDHGQSCGYLPDSSSTTYDKLNVRQGRYAIWGPLHIIAKVGGDGKPSSPLAASVISNLTFDGLSTADKQAMIDLETGAHVIPQCAMQVSRTAEVGTQTLSTPDEPCGCYFEKKASGSPTSSCTVCSDDTACAGTAATPKCRYGFCEAK
jgi:ABC-type phosphate transport system substrate-binding protein